MSDIQSTSPWGEPATMRPAPGRATSSLAPGAARTTGVDLSPTVNRPLAAPPRYVQPPSRIRRVLRIVRATVGLVIIAAGLGLALAATLGALVWLIAAAIHQAANS